MEVFILNEVPFLFDYVNAETSKINPSTLHVKNTSIALYYRRYLLLDAISTFKLDCPENWAKNMILYTLLCNGYFAVFKTDKYGVLGNPCTLGGYTAQYTPSFCMVTNPLLGQNKYIIEKDCALVHINPNYAGIMDVVQYYADKLALCDEALHTNIANSKLAYVFMTDNKAGAESFKKMFDQIQEGNLAVFYDKNLNPDDDTKNPWQFFNQNISSTFIANDINVLKQNIVNEFRTAVGIPNANIDKRERLIDSEVNSNNIATYCKPELWVETFNESARTCEKLFGITCKLSLRFVGVDNGDSYGDRII